MMLLYSYCMAASSSQLLIDRFLQYADSLRTARTEKVVLLFLDEHLQVIAQSCLSQRHPLQAEFCARSIFAPALIHDAKNIVVMHNHPSGSVTPSSADYVTTLLLAQAGSILQIAITDHLIVTTTDYFSFRKAGIL